MRTDDPAPQTPLIEPLASVWTNILLAVFVVTIGRFLKDILVWTDPLAMLAPAAAALLAVYSVARSPRMSFARWSVVVAISLAAAWVSFWLLPDLLAPLIGTPLAISLPLLAFVVGMYWCPQLIVTRKRATPLVWSLTAAAIAIGTFLLLTFALP